MTDAKIRDTLGNRLQGSNPTPSAIKVREVRVPLVDAAILAVAAKLSLQGNASLNEEDEAVLAALLRAHPSAGETKEELGRWLAEMDEAQLRGVISNTKGVLHEMRFVAMENSDGDTIYAAQFEATNHAGYDVVFSDNASGTEWVAQLKATSSEAYVREWMENHPDGEVLVTAEIAERMGLDGSAISNEELTVDTEHLVDQLVTAEQSDSIWDYVPGLTAVSVAAVIYEMHRRLRRGEISRDQFAWMTARATGKSAARVVLLTSLLSVPVINIATALALIAGFLSSSGSLERVNAYIDKKRAVMDAVQPFKAAAFEEGLMIEGALKSAEHMSAIEAQLRNESEEYRRIYWSSYYNSLAEIKGLDSDEDRRISGYKDPADLVPSEHPVGEIEDLIREKVAEIEIQRLQIFNRAKLTLSDSCLRPHFIKSIEESVNAEGVRNLLSVVEGYEEV